MIVAASFLSHCNRGIKPAATLEVSLGRKKFFEGRLKKSPTWP